MDIRALVCLIIVSATNANSVEVSTKSYPCCGGNPEIKVDEPGDCEQRWEESEGNVIATYHPDHPPECSAPCSSVSLGKLRMHGCHNVQLRMVCLLPNRAIDWDKKTNYIANTDNCPGSPEAFAKSAASPRYYGWVPSPLLIVFTICVGILLYRARRIVGNHILAHR